VPSTGTTSRADEQPVAAAYLVGRHVLEFGVPGEPAMRQRRGAVQQRPQFPAGSPRCVLLQRLAAGQHQHDDERGEVFADHDRAHDGGHREDVDTPLSPEQVPHHPDRGVRRHGQGVAAAEPPSR